MLLKQTCSSKSRLMSSSVLLYRLSTTTSGTMVPLCQCGSRRLLMTGEGNAYMAPSPVASAPGELTVEGSTGHSD